MYKIITLAAAASLLTLAACNRETETAPIGDDAATAAASAEDVATDTSTSAPASSTGGGPSAAPSPGSETMDPAGDASAAPTGAGIQPPSDATRANAQQAAEETNLHPKPPMN